MGGLPYGGKNGYNRVNILGGPAPKNPNLAKYPLGAAWRPHVVFWIVLGSLVPGHPGYSHGCIPLYPPYGNTLRCRFETHTHTHQRQIVRNSLYGTEGNSYGCRSVFQYKQCFLFATSITCLGIMEWGFPARATFAGLAFRGKTL